MSKQSCILTVLVIAETRIMQISREGGKETREVVKESERIKLKFLENKSAEKDVFNDFTVSSTALGVLNARFAVHKAALIHDVMNENKLNLLTVTRT